MQGFDEFRDDDDDDDAGVAPHPPADVPPVIGFGAGASVASAGAARLGLQFRQTRRTFEELMEGEVIARKHDCGAKGSKTYIAIRKSATMPLPDKLLSTGSTIPSAGLSDGSQSTMSDRMISLINRQMTQTENSDMASLLAELKNCLQRN
jgi:hypothetical protein